MISVTDHLDFDHLKDIYTSGYTRIPVYHNRKDIIVGIVFTKDLILVDPNDEIPVASILPFCSRALNAAPRGTSLEKLLEHMQASRSHLYFVTDTIGPPKKKVARVEKVVGIVTMEDLIEELISIEIIDETDVFTDNRSKGRVGNSRGQRRLEFFEMLQRREELQTHGPSSGRQSLIGNERPTTDEVRALASYLSNNVVVFRPPHMSSAVLRKLLQRCSVSVISQEEVTRGRYVYVRGVPASFCCLLLHGRLQIRAGNEGFSSEIGPWTTLALQALSDIHYTPDFTARVECAARIIIISRTEMQAVLGISSPVPARDQSPVLARRYLPDGIASATAGVSAGGFSLGSSAGRHTNAPGCALPPVSLSTPDSPSLIGSVGAMGDEAAAATWSREQRSATAESDDAGGFGEGVGGLGAGAMFVNEESSEPFGSGPGVVVMGADPTLSLAARPRPLQPNAERRAERHSC